MPPIGKVYHYVLGVSKEADDAIFAALQAIPDLSPEKDWSTARQQQPAPQAQQQPACTQQHVEDNKKPEVWAQRLKYKHTDWEPIVDELGRFPG